jgi:Mg2+ and Co2+ transporter CorA
MLRTYTFVKSKLQLKDLSSKGEVEKLAKEVNWLWVDCLEPNDEELQIIAELLQETKVIDMIKTQQILSQYERINDHVLIPALLVDFKEKLETYPLYIFVNEKTFITVRNKNASRPINNTLRTLQDCVMKVKCDTSSSFVVSRLFHEITGENLNTIMTLRSSIAEIEEKVLEKPADEKIDKAVFKLKREIANLERVLWVQRETMLAIQEGVVPTIQATEIDRQTLNNTISNVSRELSLLSAHNDALNSILSVRGLGMIHRVETMLVYLTILMLVVNVFLVLLELGMFHF